jgi:hypothetical protein
VSTSILISLILIKMDSSDGLPQAERLARRKKRMEDDFAKARALDPAFDTYNYEKKLQRVNELLHPMPAGTQAYDPELWNAHMRLKHPEWDIHSEATKRAIVNAPFAQKQV